MPAPIDFYFDLTSPYSYIAADQIEALAAQHGRTVNWHPILLGFVFRTTGVSAPTEIPIKGDYSKRDFARSARMVGLDYRHPDVFPVNTIAAARITIWLQWRKPDMAKPWVMALFKALFTQNKNISDQAVLAEVGQSLGLSASELGEAANDPSVKDALKARTDEAMARGVFGAPFFFVDGEPFWGNDRLPQIEHWLKTGGF